MSFARIQAYLGLDISAFQSGLEKANRGAEKWKKTMQAGDIKGGLKEAFSAGAIIAGFSEILKSAQEVRKEAKEIGRTVDEGTASVARYADQWDRIKKGAAEAGISILSVFTRAGEKIGEFQADQMWSRLRGMTPGQAKRTREISEAASARADELEAGRGDAKKRGEERKKKKAEDEKKAAEELEKIRKEGSEQFEKNQFDALDTAGQIAALEKKRAEAIKQQEGGSTMSRAKARLERYKIEHDLADKRKELEKQITDEYEKQAKYLLDQSAKEQKAYDERSKRVFELADKQIEAEKKVADAKEDLATQRRDFLAPSLAEVAAGKRGKLSDRVTAREIIKTEDKARRLNDSGKTITVFNSRTQRNEEVSAGFLQRRAEEARRAFELLKSDDREPYKAAQKSLKDAGDELKKAAQSLKDGIAEMKDITIDVDAS